MRDVARKELDRVEALPVKTGQLDLTGYLTGTRSLGSFGGSIDYTHRPTRRLSVFGRAYGGVSWNDVGTTPEYGVTGGIRYRW
jgi:hypothetical protein